MLKPGKKNDKVQVGIWASYGYARSKAARVVSFDGDGKTQGTYTVQYPDLSTETVAAHLVNVWWEGNKFPAFRRAPRKSAARKAVAK